MNRRLEVLMLLLIIQVAMSFAAREEFHWNWRDSQSLLSAPSLKDAKIGVSQRTALAEAIQQQIGPPDRADPDMASIDQVRRAILSANVEKISLNQSEDARHEVVAQVQHLCSGDGNCTLWFFERTAKGYRLLLDALGQGFTVKKTSTNGFRDLVINMHGSATHQALRVYRYARDGYSRVACYDADWAPLENGVVHQLKEPRIAPSPCY